MKQTVHTCDLVAQPTYPMPVYTCGFYQRSSRSDFIGSLSYDKTKAINRVHSLGYITDEEAKQLKEEGHARRNPTTNIMIYESIVKVTMLCIESTLDTDNVAHIETVFKLSFDKLTNTVINEMNSDIVN